MDIRTVLERVKLLTGDEREDLLLMLSEDAVENLQRRLICPEAECESFSAALCAAAAARAAYEFQLLAEAASPKSVTAGEVRADFGEGSEKALCYLVQCERAVSGLLRDDTFYFGVTENGA